MAKKEKSAFDVLPPDLVFGFGEWSRLAQASRAARNPSQVHALNEQKSAWEQMHGIHAKGLFEEAEAYLASESDDESMNGVDPTSISPLDELSAIGLSVPVDEEAARNLWPLSFVLMPVSGVPDQTNLPSPFGRLIGPSPIMWSTRTHRTRFWKK
jgi:hypothetical protein